MNGFSIEKVFEDLYNTGLGVFEKLIDFEIKDRELDLARDVQLFRSAQAEETDRRQRSFFDPGPNFLSGNTGNILLLAAVGIGAVLVLRK